MRKSSPEVMQEREREEASLLAGANLKKNFKRNVLMWPEVNKCEDTLPGVVEAHRDELFTLHDAFQPLSSCRVRTSKQKREHSFVLQRRVRSLRREHATVL